MAVLGLLDILNSQQHSSPDRFELLYPQVERALDTAMHSLPELQAWHFLATLIGKFPNEAPPERIGSKIRSSALALAHRKPDIAFDFLINESQNPRSTSPIILAGLADGSSDRPEVVTSYFRKLSPQLVLQLISLGKTFVHTVIDLAKHDPSNWMAPLAHAFESADDELRRKVRQQVIPLLDDATEAPLLGPLLEGVTPAELTGIVDQIGQNTGFAIAAFDEALCNAARDDNGIQSLRNAIVRHANSFEADRFLLNTMRVDGQDIAWLCTEVPPDRACNLLARLLDSAPDRALVAVQRDPNARRLILATLSGSLSVGAAQAARMLALSDTPVELFLETGKSSTALFDGSRTRQTRR